MSNHDTVLDLYARVERECRQAFALAFGSCEVASSMPQDFVDAARAAAGAVMVGSLAAWCRWRVSNEFGQEAGETREEVEDRLRFELLVTSQHFGNEGDAGALETGADEQAEDVEAESLRVAQSAAFGWPTISKVPVEWQDEGRFARAHPLEFPMGIADLDDPRLLKVSPQEWCQHLPWWHQVQRSGR